MENARIASFLLLLLTIIIAGVRVWNSSTNIESEWNYIAQAVNSLETAKETPDLEAKRFYIQEAIGLYQEGPNLLGIQMLSRQNSSIEIDYLLPKVITDLEEERMTAVNLVRHAPRALAVSVLIGALAITTLVGTIVGIVDEEKYSYSNWTTEDQCIYVAIIVASFLALFVGSLP